MNLSQKVTTWTTRQGRTFIRNQTRSWGMPPYVSSYPPITTGRYNDTEMDWGLKTTKKTERFSRKQTPYLLRQFQTGERKPATK